MLPDRTLRVVAHFEDSRPGRGEPALAREARRRRRPGTRRLVRRRLQADRVELERQRRRARPAAAASRRATCSPRCTTGRCCSRPAEAVGVPSRPPTCECRRSGREGRLPPLESHSHVLGSDCPDPSGRAARTCECHARVGSGALWTPRVTFACPASAAQTPGPGYRARRRRWVAISCSWRLRSGLLVGGGGLGPGAVGVELPAGGVLVEGEVEDARRPPAPRPSRAA